MPTPNAALTEALAELTKAEAARERLEALFEAQCRAMETQPALASTVDETAAHLLKAREQHHARRAAVEALRSSRRHVVVSSLRQFIRDRMPARPAGLLN